MMYRLSKKNRILFYSRNNPPVLKVPSGALIEIETVDCYSNVWQEGEDLRLHRMGSGNPAIGPVFIEGAIPGDVLKATIEEIRLDSTGVMLSVEGYGIIAGRFKGTHLKFIPIHEGKAVFSQDILIPVNPMIGLIGVAPEGEDVRSTLPGPHGGNMDNRLITTGTTLYLPVFVEGALFALGDLHAVMGDGEIGFNGIEISGSVKVKLEIVKGLKLNNPLLESSGYISTIASAPAMDDAIRQTIEDMVSLLENRIDISFPEMNMLLSLVGHTQICQSVSALKTARFLVEKWVLDRYGFVLQEAL